MSNEKNESKGENTIKPSLEPNNTKGYVSSTPPPKVESNPNNSTKGKS